MMNDDAVLFCFVLFCFCCGDWGNFLGLNNCALRKVGEKVEPQERILGHSK